MSRYRWVVLSVASVTMGFGSASADAIRPSGEAGATVVAPELACPGPEAPGASRLALSPALLEGTWTDLSRRPLLSSDLAGASLAAVAPIQGSSQVLVRPELPRDPLLGAASERVLASLPARGSENVADADSGHNIRIPEPASLALVAIGVLGLAARGRLRRALQPQVAKNPA